MDIEGAGKIIDHEQFRLADKHARCRGPLRLPTGEA
jgi:hypothetical protein